MWYFTQQRLILAILSPSEDISSFKKSLKCQQKNKKLNKMDECLFLII